MATIGSNAARAHFSEILKRVAKGQEITITKHGVPVARLVPVGDKESVDRKSAIAELRRFRQGRKLGKLSIRQLIDEGRSF